MLKIGFELEAFLLQGDKIVVPETTMPRDSYPGILEFRGSPSTDIWEAWASVEKHLAKFKDQYPNYLVIYTNEHVFTREDLVTIRKRLTSNKQPLEICNLYGKFPRHLGNKTIASCQVNLSNLKEEGHLVDKIWIPSQYGLLNIPKIVRELDQEFADEIKVSKRQPGFYAIKDGGIRLEYRSLPNFVWNDPKFINRLNKVLKNVHCD